MNVLVSLVVVCGLFLIGLLGGTPRMGWVFGVVIPYVAVALFFGGLIYRVWGWASSPVPFRIPTARSIARRASVEYLALESSSMILPQRIPRAT